MIMASYWALSGDGNDTQLYGELHDSYRVAGRKNG